MKKTLTLTAIALTFAATSALAGNHDRDHNYYDYDRTTWNKEGKTERKFIEMDANNDGLVSRSEHQVYTAYMFNHADVNNDDLLTRQEFWDHKNNQRHNTYRGEVHYDKNRVEIDHSMDPKKYNGKNADRVYEAEEKNRNY